MTTQVRIRESSLFSRPLGTAILVLGLVLVWMIFAGNSMMLALLAIAIILFLGFNNPIWAMSTFLVSQFIIPSYILGPISLRLVMLILIGVIIWRTRTREKIQFGKNVKRVIIPALILFGVSIISNLTHSSLSWVFKDFRIMFGGLLIVIFIPAVVKNITDLKRLCGIVLVGVTVSAIVAIMQHYNILGMAQNIRAPDRVQGIAESELQLSYTLGVGLLAVLGLLFFRGINTGKVRLLIPAILMLPALYFTYTRSALIALVFGLMALVLFLRTRIRGEVILLVLLAATLYLSMSGLIDHYSFGARSTTGQQDSATARKILWQAGVAIAMDNPVLGIGGDQYLKISPQYTSRVDPSLIQFETSRYWRYRTLGQEPVHNDFLNMWVSYGFIALVSFLWINIAVLHNFLGSFRMSKQRFIRGLSIGLAAGLIVYSVNALYHNMLSEFPLFWIITGFSLAIAKLAVPSNNKV